jgi:hypothetical protein
MTKPARWKGEAGFMGRSLDNRLDICSDPDFATHSDPNIDPLAEPIVVMQMWRNRRRDEVVRISLSRFEGRPIVDVRVFFTTKTGHMQATRKGVAFGIAKLSELRKALEKAELKALDLDLIEAVT